VTPAAEPHGHPDKEHKIRSMPLSGRRTSASRLPPLPLWLCGLTFGSRLRASA
jgi:hypothetical protein